MEVLISCNRNCHLRLLLGPFSVTVWEGRGEVFQFTQTGDKKFNSRPVVPALGAA
jgi:hypothetical protein